MAAARATYPQENRTGEGVGESNCALAMMLCAAPCSQTNYILGLLLLPQEDRHTDRHCCQYFKRRLTHTAPLGSMCSGICTSKVVPLPASLRRRMAP